MVYTNNRWMTSFQRIPICFSQKVILIRKYLRNRNGFALKGAIRVIAINRLLLSVYSVNIRLFFENKFFFLFFFVFISFHFFPSIFSYEILNKMCTNCEKIKHFYWKKKSNWIQNDVKRTRAVMGCLSAFGYNTTRSEIC